MTPKLSTKNGYDFFAISSLLQKSLRRGDVILAARACNELLPKYGNYVWNRLLTVSAEDCAELVTGEVIALYLAWCKVSKDSNPNTKPAQRGHRIFFQKAIVLLAKSKHSRDADELGQLVSDRMPKRVFEKALAEAQAIPDDESFEIPEWVYDMHTSRGKRAGGTRDQFLRAEHDALMARCSIFCNFDEMVASWGYVEPDVKYR
jgi:hypothetical protein